METAGREGTVVTPKSPKLFFFPFLCTLFNIASTVGEKEKKKTGNTILYYHTV
jgi:hypothetical protein